MVAVELPHSTGEPVHDTYDAHGDRLTKTVTDGTDTRTWAYRKDGVSSRIITSLQPT